MKKMLSFLLVSLMLFALASCGGDPVIPTDVNWEECLVCETVNGMLTVTGTTDLGKAQQVLVIPATIGGVPLKAIGENAFDGCQSLKSIYINADSSISVLNNGAFAGAPSLTKIFLSKKHTEVTVSKDLMNGAAAGAKIYVRAEDFANFTTDYAWGAHSGKLQRQS